MNVDHILCQKQERKEHKPFTRTWDMTLFCVCLVGCVEESTGVLKKAESEYKGHRSLLMRTRNLLSTMQRQDVLDR